MQLKRGTVPVTGPSVLLAGPSVLLMALRSPYRALLNCLIVGHKSAGLNCIGWQGTL